MAKKEYQILNIILVVLMVVVDLVIPLNRTFNELIFKDELVVSSRTR